MNEKLIFHQLFEKTSSTYTYLLADAEIKEAIIIDPVIETLERDINLINDLGLNLKYILDTHVHADHVTASGELRKRTKAKVGLSAAYDLSCADLHLEDSQELSFGQFTVKSIHTPGHTIGCLTYQVDKMVFTGDALLIRGCGRTDFQQGSSEKLFLSVREKIFNLPDDTVVYPAHDYKGLSKTDIAIEKKLNPRLNLSISKEEFINIMASLNLAYPKKIQEAVPANLQCGLIYKSELLNSNFIEGIPTVTAENVHGQLGGIKIYDVRGMDEYNNELGHIPQSKNVSLGRELDERLHTEDRQKEIIFVCRSGKRSAEATKLALNKGFEKVYNLAGGMLTWNELKLSIERDMGGS